MTDEALGVYGLSVQGSGFWVYGLGVRLWDVRLHKPEGPNILPSRNDGPRKPQKWGWSFGAQFLNGDTSKHAVQNPQTVTHMSCPHADASVVLGGRRSCSDRNSNAELPECPGKTWKDEAAGRDGKVLKAESDFQRNFGE